jgi:hypothetical protein
MGASHRAIVLGVIALLLGVVSGCNERDRGPYRWEHGDRIDRFGHREVGWCDSHREDEHCRALPR